MTFQADKDRLTELYRIATERGMKVTQWNLAGSGGDLPETVSEMVALMEKMISGDYRIVDPATLLDATQ